MHFGAEFSVHFSKVDTFSGKNVCTYGHKFFPEPSITSKIHREPPPGLQNKPGLPVKKDIMLTTNEGPLSHFFFFKCNVLTHESVGPTNLNC